MLARCFDPKNKKYKYYGAKGIKVCDRWMDFDSFYADIGDPPASMHLDRINSNGDYCPENCRLVTLTENNNNRSNTVFITAFGITKARGEWCRIYGIHLCTLRDRIAGGWPPELALTIGSIPTSVCRRYDE